MRPPRGGPADAPRASPGAAARASARGSTPRPLRHGGKGWVESRHGRCAARAPRCARPECVAPPCPALRSRRPSIGWRSTRRSHLRAGASLGRGANERIRTRSSLRARTRRTRAGEGSVFALRLDRLAPGDRGRARVQAEAQRSRTEEQRERPAAPVEPDRAQPCAVEPGLQLARQPGDENRVEDERHGGV